MNINVRTVYAMIAIGELASNQGNDAIKASDISDKYEIPPRFLEITLNDLKTNGIINSKRGAKGGFYLSKPADSITMLDIIKVTESSNKIFECEPLQNKSLCLFKGIFENLNNMINDYLSKITAKTLAEIIQSNNTNDFII